MFRYLLLIACVCVVSLCFVFYPFPQTQDSYNKYDYYQHVSGSASDHSSLAADELNPDQYQLNLPEVNLVQFRRKIETFLCDEDITAANHGHEECRN